MPSFSNRNDPAVITCYGNLVSPTTTLNWSLTSIIFSIEVIFIFSHKWHNKPYIFQGWIACQLYFMRVDTNDVTWVARGDFAHIFPLAGRVQPLDNNSTNYRIYRDYQPNGKRDAVDNIFSTLFGIYAVPMLTATLSGVEQLYGQPQTDQTWCWWAWVRGCLDDRFLRAFSCLPHLLSGNISPLDQTLQHCTLYI